jgi:hypothetical protein
MNYVVATGLLASNCLMATQEVLPDRSRGAHATLRTRAIDWLSDRHSKGPQYGKYSYRIA